MRKKKLEILAYSHAFVVMKFPIHLPSMLFLSFFPLVSTGGEALKFQVSISVYFSGKINQFFKNPSVHWQWNCSINCTHIRVLLIAEVSAFKMLSLVFLHCFPFSSCHRSSIVNSFFPPVYSRFFLFALACPAQSISVCIASIIVPLFALCFYFSVSLSSFPVVVLATVNV